MLLLKDRPRETQPKNLDLSALPGLGYLARLEVACLAQRALFAVRAHRRKLAASQHEASKD